MRPRSDDRGDIAIEYAILTPIIFVIFALIYVFGRIADVGGTIDSGTRDAARVASEAPDYAQASQAATNVVREAVGGDSKECLATLQVGVSRNFAPGKIITVTAQCTYPISDAGLPGAPGYLTMHSVFSSIVDPNRSIG